MILREVVYSCRFSPPLYQRLHTHFLSAEAPLSVTGAASRRVTPLA